MSSTLATLSIVVIILISYFITCSIWSFISQIYEENERIRKRIEERKKYNNRFK